MGVPCCCGRIKDMDQHDPVRINETMHIPLTSAPEGCCAWWAYEMRGLWRRLLRAERRICDSGGSCVDNGALGQAVGCLAHHRDGQSDESLHIRTLLAAVDVFVRREVETQACRAADAQRLLAELCDAAEALHQVQTPAGKAAAWSKVSSIVEEARKVLGA